MNEDATTSAPSPTETFKAAVRRNEGRLWAFGLAGAVLVVGVGLVVAPDVFWDRFLWEDIWGPTLADARGVGGLCWDGGQVTEASRTVGGQGIAAFGCPDGGTLAHSGYTLTAEITYGLVMAALLFGIYRHVLQRHRVDTGGAFLAGLLPLVLLGPFARVLEDANVFDPRPGEPGAFAPLFISPWIYFQIAAYALAFLGVAILLERADASRAARRRAVGAVLALETVVYTFVTAAYADEFRVVAPAWSFALAAAAAFALYVFVAERKGPAWRFHGTVFVLGLPLVAPSAFLMLRWVVDGPWQPTDRGLAPVAGMIMLGLAVAATFLVWWVARLVGAARPYARTFAAGTSLALVFGHMVDGFATWIALKNPFGMDLGTYVEKHPVSDLILEAFRGTPLADTVLDGILFPVAKLAMVLLVVHLLRKEFGDVGTQDPEGTLAGLVAMAVFVLGFAPGTRNLLLVTFGF